MGHVCFTLNSRLRHELVMNRDDAPSDFDDLPVTKLRAAALRLPGDPGGLFAPGAQLDEAAFPWGSERLFSERAPREDVLREDIVREDIV